MKCVRMKKKERERGKKIGDQYIYYYYTLHISCCLLLLFLLFLSFPISHISSKNETNNQKNQLTSHLIIQILIKKYFYLKQIFFFFHNSTCSRMGLVGLTSIHPIRQQSIICACLLIKGI